jgi:hypothetical protein
LVRGYKGKEAKRYMWSDTRKTRGCTDRDRDVMHAAGNLAVNMPHCVKHFHFANNTGSVQTDTHIITAGSFAEYIFRV